MAGPAASAGSQPPSWTSIRHDDADRRRLRPVRRRIMARFATPHPGSSSPTTCDSLRFCRIHGVQMVLAFQSAWRATCRNGPNGGAARAAGRRLVWLGGLPARPIASLLDVIGAATGWPSVGFAAPGAGGSAFAFGHSDALVNAGRGDAKPIPTSPTTSSKAPDTMATTVSTTTASPASACGTRWAAMRRACASPPRPTCCNPHA